MVLSKKKNNKRESNKILQVQVCVVLSQRDELSVQQEMKAMIKKRVACP